MESQNAATWWQIFCPQTPPYPYDPRGIGSKGQNSEHGHLAYQIKGNHEFSNMVASILPAYPPPTPTLEMESKGQNSTFSEHGHVTYQIKGDH